MQKWIKIIFTVYLYVLVKVIIFKYPFDELYAIAQTWRRDVILEGLGTANFIPFKTFKIYIKYADKLNSFENLAGNILAFVPFGFLLPLVRKNKSNLADIFANALILVVGIEVFQLFSAFGAFDVDDIILNCLGAVIGYFVYNRCYHLFPALQKFCQCGREEKIEEDDYGAYFEEN